MSRVKQDGSVSRSLSEYLRILNEETPGLMASVKAEPRTTRKVTRGPNKGKTFDNPPTYTLHYNVVPAPKGIVIPAPTESGLTSDQVRRALTVHGAHPRVAARTAVSDVSCALGAVAAYRERLEAAEANLTEKEARLAEVRAIVDALRGKGMDIPAVETPQPAEVEVEPEE